MNCPQAEELLQQYLDGEPIPDRSNLDQHLAACRPCREQHALARRLREGLQLIAAPAPPAQMVEQIVSRIRQERPSRQRLRRRFLAMGALAASILALVLVRLALPDRDSDRTGFSVVYDRVAGLFGRQVVVSPPAGAPEIETDPVPPQGPPPPTLRESVADAGTAVVDLTRRTADETVGQSRLLLPEPVARPAWPDPEEVPPEVEPAARSLREASQGAASGLEPVASSARRAIGLFLREVPAAEPVPQE
jgi:hypothetical protein